MWNDIAFDEYADEQDGGAEENAEKAVRIVGYRGDAPYATKRNQS